MPANLKKLEAMLALLATEFIDRLEALDGQCDFAQDVALWFPLHVIMTILGVPQADEGLMLKLTQNLVGSADPKVAGERSSTEVRLAAIKSFFDYFADLSAERRKHPRDDVASIIANAEIDGRPINDFEAMSYYVILATAGHDTTSSTISGGLLALLQNPGEFARLRTRPELLPSTTDEMLRWVSPVRHFFRTATEDYDLRGQAIKAGEALMMCYPSGNRDDEVFADPFSFKIDRSPNKHVAFGFGAHMCLGMHLAKMEIRALFAELLSRTDHIALTGEPVQTAGTLLNGLKRLPIRYTTRKRAA